MVIKDWMTPTPKTIGHDISIEKAKEFMRENHCHHLPVLNDGKLVGVLSDRDLSLIANLPNLSKVSVGELMNEEPIILPETHSLEEAAQKMLEHKVHSVIVSKDSGGYGILTATDLLRHFTE